jgi:hypothetical protein
VSNFDHYVGCRTCQIVPITALPSASIGDENASCAPAFHSEWSSAMQRRRFNQEDTLEQRLADEAKRLREKAKSVRSGAAREALIRKARQAETGSQISEWLRSPGLRPPE